MQIKVQVQGEPAFGIIDTEADITIIGGNLFKRVATIACLKKRDFKRADKTPRPYEQKPFSLDGRMDLDISFGERTRCTPVYVKMDTQVQLLLFAAANSEPLSTTKMFRSGREDGSSEDWSAGGQGG